jgi:hypothetical protein
MSDIIEEQNRAINASRKAIAEIDELCSNPVFQAFMDRADAVAHDMAGEILENEKLTPEERENLRHKRLGIVEVLRQPAIDRQQHVFNLQALGAESFAEDGEDQ